MDVLNLAWNGLAGLAKMVWAAITGGSVEKVLEDRAKNVEKIFDKLSSRNKALGRLVYGYEYEEDFAPKKQNEKEDFSSYEEEEKLKQALEKLDEKHRQHSFEQLDNLGKINDLEKQRISLVAIANENTLEGVEASSKILDIDKEILKLNEKIAQKKAKAKQEIKDKQAKLADIQRQHAFEQLSTFNKILDLEKQITEQKAKANKTTKEGLDASMQVLNLQKQLSVEESKLENLRNQAKKTEHDYHYSNLSDDEKLDWLKTEQSKSSKYMYERSERGYQSKIDFYDKQKQIDALTENKGLAKSDNVITTSLGAIGGGGNVYSSTSLAEKQLNETKKQQQTLEQIVTNTQALIDKDDTAFLQ